MMKIELKSRNFEKLQRFPAFSTQSEKSEQISLNSVKIATKFEKIANVLACLMLKTPNFVDEMLLK